MTEWIANIEKDGEWDRLAVCCDGPRPGTKRYMLLGEMGTRTTDGGPPDEAVMRASPKEMQDFVDAISACGYRTYWEGKPKKEEFPLFDEDRKNLIVGRLVAAIKAAIE